MVRELAASSWISDERENIFSLWVDVSVCPLKPFRLVDDFGEKERRLQRIERFAFVEHVEVGVGAAAENVGDIFSRPSLGDQPRPELRACGRNVRYMDFGKFFFEGFDQAAVAVNI